MAGSQHLALSSALLYDVTSYIAGDELFYSTENATGFFLRTLVQCGTKHGTLFWRRSLSVLFLEASMP
jgi:hypothetical protein